MAVPSRLRWKCRRGMREMDILCTRFVEGIYDQLDEAGRSDLERLLECADQDILAWLTGDGVPQDPALVQLVLQMRDVTSQPVK